MRIFVKIILAIILLAVALSSVALIKNKVPLFQTPGFGKRLLVYLSRNSAHTDPQHDWPELRARVYSVSIDELYDRVDRAVETLGWTLVRKNESEHAMHAVVSTPWLGFKDDVRIQLEQVADRGTALHITSQSRVGRADYGANTSHIMALHEALVPIEEQSGQGR